MTCPYMMLLLLLLRLVATAAVRCNFPLRFDVVNGISVLYYTNI